MASGASHAKASIIASIPAGLIVGISLGSIFYGLGTSLGSILGIALTPDLDQEMTTFFEWKLMKKAGPLAFLWMLAWSPYALIIPHRSFWSHFPVIGTVLRLTYIMFLPTILYVYKGYSVVLPEFVWEGLVGAFVGLVMSDFLHWVMDL